ncbi:hypothetical protein [Ruminococcus flavefaciens]|uniref:hypothetical protein n=1 Tax=Ruminococcus flavefaciens TaxID=1265 RepID=UPI0004921FBC|nr:hypothetical protein [Ruminococcus flavefaciens]
MDNSRMSTADMLQYCNEALAWDDFGPIDIFFFESVKKILLGQCSAFEEPEAYTDDLMGIERPVRDVELEPEYGNYADIYYGEEGDEEIPDYSRSDEDVAFSADIFGDGFFSEPEQAAEGVAAAEAETEEHEPEPENVKNEEKKAAEAKPAKKQTKKPAKKKAEKAADSDKHEEKKEGGFTVSL